MPDNFGIPTYNEIMGIKTTKRKRTTKKTTKKKTNKKFTLTPATKRLIIKEVGKCERCGKKENLQVHHIKEQNEGGGHTQSNLIVLCYGCHKNKAHRGSFSVAEQRKKVRGRSQKLKNNITVILNKAKKRQTKTTKCAKKTAKRKTTRKKNSNPFEIDFKPKYKF